MTVAARAFHTSLRRGISSDKYLIRSWSDEYKVLESLLAPAPKRRAQDLPYSDQIRKLRFSEESRRASTAPFGALRNASRSQLVDLDAKGPFDDQIAHLVTGAFLTSKDVDAWLKINVLSSGSGTKSLDEFHAAIVRMIALSSAHGLRVVMQFLVKYWQQGIHGQRPSVAVAQRQAKAVLQRAFSVHQPTRYDIAYGRIAPQLGIHDFEKFDRLVASFFEYLDVDRPQGPDLHPLEDALLRLLSRSGSIETAQKQFIALLHDGRHASTETTDEFVNSLSRHISAQRDVFGGTAAEFTSGAQVDLYAFKDLLMSQAATPATVSFLLVWVSSIDEFYNVLNVAERSEHAKQILQTCQLEMIGALASISAGAESDEAVRFAAYYFGLVERLGKLLQTPTLDRILIALAKLGDVPGMLRVLDLRSQLETKLDTPVNTLDPAVLHEMLDSVPLANFPGSSKPALLELMARIRPMVSDEALSRYVGALQRSGMADQLRAEWKSANTNIQSMSCESLMAFLAAFTGTGSASEASEVLSCAFKTSSRVDVVQEVLSHNLVDPAQVYRSVAVSAAQDSWSEADLDVVVGHIAGAKQAILSGNTREIDLLWPPVQFEP